MSAFRHRNRLDVIIERITAGASVADQLSFQSWTPEAQTIARRAVALEIDKAGESPDDSDKALGDAVEAVRVHYGELKAYIEKFSGFLPAGKPDSDAEVARAEMLAELAELSDALGTLEMETRPL